LLLGHGISRYGSSQRASQRACLLAYLLGYVLHSFLSKGKTCASAIVKMIFKRGLETIPPAKALQIMGYGTLTPELMTSEIGTHTKGVESVLHSNGM